MNRIIQLPDHIISLIAAGEVIERPAYAVKELVENSIDAGATVIEIHLEESGLKRIQVIDNGHGMGREDLLLSFLSHTTSKLAHEELSGIRTLGFRGEALSSIASVSDLSIKSRTRDNPGGLEVQIQQGVIRDVTQVGMPIGTIVTVDNLFSTIPARKKFLKSAQTELRHIVDIVQRLALSHPFVHFILTHNSKVLVDLPSKHEIHERVKHFLGSTLYDQLLPVTYEDGYISVNGFIGVPQTASKQNAHQFLFVNNRAVTDRLLARAIREAYGTLLPGTATPVFVLSLHIPAEFVDVNVHPRKEHVAFTEIKSLFDGLKMAIQVVLSEHNLTFRLSPFTQNYSAKLGETTSYTGQLLKQTIKSETVSLHEKTTSQYVQIMNTYIIAETTSGVSIYDQHAAHERVLFEDLLATFIEERQKKDQIQLPEPIHLSVSLSNSLLLTEYEDTFRQIGFTIEHFHDTDFIVRTIPSVFKGRRVDRIIQDMLVDLAEVPGSTNIDIRTTRMLAFLSCRAAVKAGDRLSSEQMKILITKLAATPNNVTCPHGRPTRYELSKHELDVLFKRK